MKRGDAEARRNGAESLDVEPGLIANALEEAPGEAIRRHAWRLADDDGDLFSAASDDEVGLAMKHRSDQFGHDLEDLIAYGMSKRVIDALEKVDVDDEDMSLIGFVPTMIVMRCKRDDKGMNEHRFTMTREESGELVSEREALKSFTIGSQRDDFSGEEKRSRFLISKSASNIRELLLEPSDGAVLLDDA